MEAPKVETLKAPTARKDDEGKLRWELVPWDSAREVAKVFTFGAQKYGDRNWEKGLAMDRLVGATLRHLMDWISHTETDPESKLPHLAHAVANLLMILHFQLKLERDWTEPEFKK